MSAFMSAFMSICLHFCLSTYLYLYLSISIFSVYCLHLSILHVFVLSIPVLSTFPSACINDCLYLSVFVCVIFCPSLYICPTEFLCLSVCQFKSICISVCLLAFLSASAVSHCLHLSTVSHYLPCLSDSLFKFSVRTNVCFFMSNWKPVCLAGCSFVCLLRFYWLSVIIYVSVCPWYLLGEKVEKKVIDLKLNFCQQK